MALLDPPHNVERYELVTVDPKDDRSPYGMLLPNEKGPYIAFSDYERLAARNLVLRATLRMLKEEPVNKAVQSTKTGVRKSTKRLSRSKLVQALELAVQWRDKGQGYYEKGLEKGVTETEQHILAARMAALNYCAEQLEALLGEQSSEGG